MIKKYICLVSTIRTHSVNLVPGLVGYIKRMLTKMGSGKGLFQIFPEFKILNVQVMHNSYKSAQSSGTLLKLIVTRFTLVMATFILFM